MGARMDNSHLFCMMRCRGLFRATLLCLVLFFVASCRYDNPKEFSKGIIVGGEVADNSELESVVGLTLRNKLFCSGTLINSETIYTASHCFFHPENFVKIAKYYLAGRPELNSVNQKRIFIEKLMSYQLAYKKREVKIYFGPGKEGGKFSGTLGLKDVHIDPSYFAYIKYLTFYKLKLMTSYEEKNLKLDTPLDFAELTLSSPVEGIKTFPVIKKSKLHLLEGALIRLVGFGHRLDPIENNLGLYGRKFQVDLKFLKIEKRKLSVSLPEKSACYGDSGGGAFLLDKEGNISKYVGVINGGDGSCGGKNPETGHWIKTFIHSVSQ